MSETSLAQQLKRLAVPQTSELVDKTAKPSLLFDAKEAANIDKDTFYSIGLSGLEELKAINPVFGRYERTLFDVTSVNFVRSVETAEQNKKLDEEISKFLIHCSPYFLLKPTLKTLEWLIHRFQIQEYNADSLMMLALPYYESMTFAQILQILPTDRNKTWSWLEPVKAEGVPLSKTAVFNRAATDISFFKFVCNMPLLAIKAHKTKKQQGTFTSLFTFYCTTIIGSLDNIGYISELHISHLLPSLTTGLTSALNDFIASSYIILSCLTSQVQLSSHILQLLFTKVVQVKTLKSSMKSEAVLLMIILSQCNKCVSDQSLLLLTEAEWFLPTLVEIAAEKIVVFPLVLDILLSCIEFIENKEENSDRIKKFVNAILLKLRFNSNEVEQIFRLFIDFCANLKRKSNTDLMLWSVKLMQTLEKRYPDSFDKIITDEKYSAIAKQILGLRLDYKGQSALFESLHHPVPAVREAAVKAVSKQLEPVKSSWLSETILERLSDDSPVVVKAVLKQPLHYQTQLIDSDTLINSFKKLAFKIWQKSAHKIKDDENHVEWSKLARILFKKLSELIPDNFDELTLLMSTLPFLLVTKNYCHLSAAKAILSSKLVGHNAFLKRVSEKLNPEEFTEQELKTAVWSTLKNLSALELKIDENFIQSSHTAPTINKFLIILLTASALPSNTDPAYSASLILHTQRLIQESELNYKKLRDHLIAATLGDVSGYCYEEKLPLQIIQYFLCTVINKTDVKLEHINCWWDMKEGTQQFLHNLLITTFAVNNKKVKKFKTFLKFITTALQKKKYFKESEDYCKLLCNVIVRSPDIAFECLMEMKSHLENLDDDKSLNWVVELNTNNIIMPILLIGLSSPIKETRVITLDILKYVITSTSIQSPYINFLKELISWDDEILSDSDQACVAMYMLLSPDPAVQTGYSVPLQQNFTEVRSVLLSMATDGNTPDHVIASLLELLSYVNSTDIIKMLVTLGIKILEEENISKDQVNIIENIFKRIDPSIVAAFEDDVMWTFVEKCFALHDKCILSDKKTPAVKFLKKISRELFDGLTETGKCKMIDLVVTMNADSEDGEANIAVMGMMKGIMLDSSYLIPILHSMRDVKVPLPENLQTPRKKWVRAPTWALLKTNEWRKGISFLELIQNKKKCNNVQLLLSPLFDILRRCLEFEDQSSVEYTKQLVLSAILHFCQKLSNEGKLKEVPPHVIQVELIVQCIRASQNPQTHHHALLVLVEVAALTPDKVLHDLMPIFTFVGSSVLRMDDAYSFQIILKIIETVIPILVQNVKIKEDISSVQQVLQVFVDALLDIPEHRRLALLYKLITTLDEEGSYLWLFICLVTQSEVLSYDSSKTKPDGQANKGLKMNFITDLCLEFPEIVLIKTLYQVLNYIGSLPHDKEGKAGSKKISYKNIVIFDVEKNSGKQLRHYKYILINFISSFLSTPKFIDMLLAQSGNSNLDENDIANFKLLVHEVIGYLDAVTSQVKRTTGEPSFKYWKAMKHLMEDVNGKVNAVLPNTVFLKMMKSILSAECPAKKQRKMMEILNWRLQSTILDKDELISLVPAIVNIIKNNCSPNTDNQITQQAAFIVLKLLARQIASEFPGEFEKALDCVTEIVRSGLKAGTNESNGVVLASAVLCLAELVASLGSKAIQFVPKFMSAIIDTVSRARSDPDVQEVLLLSVITTIQKVLEYHTAFINPYLDRLLTELCLLSATYSEKDNSQRSNTNVVNKLDTIRTNLAEQLEVRVLLPAVESTYSQLIEIEAYTAVTYLMALLGNSLTSSVNCNNLQKFLIKCLDFRFDNSDPEAVNIVEPSIISCAVSMVLKMNEKEFKVFFRLLDKWATIKFNQIHPQMKQRAITFFKVCVSLADVLKSIFQPYTKTFLTSAAELLDRNNLAKQTKKTLFFPWNEKGKLDTAENPGKKNSIDLVSAILNVFLLVFKHDNEHFVSEDRFNIIMKPIVDQLDNEEICLETDICDKLLIPCIGHMATSIGDDSLWKNLNHEILQKMQNSSIKVRLAAINAICEVAKKLGDSYLPLLPETIPFLAELLEDEEEIVEKACRSAVQSLESILGEEISKHFYT